ncbi:MAG TPA: ATP-binding protein [Terriglobia bacterium]
MTANLRLYSRGLDPSPLRPTAGLYLFFLLTLTVAAAGSQSTPLSPLPTLTSSEQIRELTPDQANRGYPVHLKGVVTYNRLDLLDFYIQDSTGGIYVNDPKQSVPFKPGQLLDIVGVTEDPDFAPQIGKPRYRVIGQAPLPEPRKESLDALRSTRNDSQWVEFEGVVQGAVEDHGHLTLDVERGGRLEVSIQDPAGLDPAHLIDASVRVQGVCATTFNSRNQLIGVRLDVPSSIQLSVIEPPPADPFDIPIRPISSLMVFTAQDASEHRVRVQGTVTLWRRKGFFVQEGGQGIFIPKVPPGLLKPGDRVDVVGFADVGDYTPVLQHAIWRRIGSAALPEPVNVAAKQALEGGFDTLRVSLDATLRDEKRSETDRMLVLQDGDVLFEARIEESLVAKNWPTVPPGSRLRLTGVCSVNVDRDRIPDGFSILLRSSADVNVLAKPPWWASRNTLIVLAMLAGLMLTVLAWVAVLRRRVRGQTEIIRQRLENEAALEKRFQYVARATNDTIWDWDLLTETTAWSDGIRTTFKYGAEQVGVNAAWRYNQIHPNDIERVKGTIQFAIASGEENWTAAYRFRRGDGEYAYVLDRGYVMHDASAAPVRMVGAMMDITAQKQAEDQLARERNLLRTLIDNAPDYVYVKDTEGRLLVANAALANLLGTEVDQLLGKTDFDCYPRELAQSFWRDDQQVMSSGQALVNREESNLDSRGNSNWVLTTKVPLRDRRGRVVGLVGVGRDITKRKQGEQALQRAKEAAEAASRAKSEFLANMSHEIRTPMNGIQGMVELALDTVLSPEQRQFLEAVKLSADSLLTVINDILDFSKIEAGKLDLSPVEFDLRSSLDEALELLVVQARQKGLKLTCEIDDRVPTKVIGDPIRLRQIVINLVGNAVKFTEWGEVALEVARETQHESDSTLHFVVRDTGIGIAPSKRKVIFEAFAQADGSTTRKFGGTGLGLTISSRLVEMMGGQLWVESEEEQGSRFHFTARLGFPQVAADLAESQDPELSAPHAQPHFSRKERPMARILLAEDNPVNQTLTVRLLEKGGHAVTVAKDGREALAALEKQSFDLVLMDIQMPEMDGFEATAAIREREKETGDRLPVIAMTAHAMKGDQERCLAAGMDAYLSKPIRSDEMFAVIESQLMQRSRRDDHDDRLVSLRDLESRGTGSAFGGDGGKRPLPEAVQTTQALRAQDAASIFSHR